jgi:hypothetical membrane protein
MSVRVRAAAAFPLCAGIAGVLVPVVTLLGIWLALQAAPWFSWAENALSDLGVVPESAVLFNGSMVVGGILLFIFALGVRARVSRLSGLMMSVGSVMLVGLGLVSESLFALHWTFSCLFFTLLIGSFFVLWFDDSIKGRMMAKTARGLVVVAFASCVWFWFMPGAAVPETCFLVPAFLWCAGAGIVLLILPVRAQKKTRKVSTPAMSG